MGTKTERMEFRVAPNDRVRIERAAALSGVSTSMFVIGSAVERAEATIAASTTTAVTAQYFDDLLAALDRPEVAPRLAAAAEQARRSARIERR